MNQSLSQYLATLTLSRLYRWLNRSRGSSGGDSQVLAKGAGMQKSSPRKSVTLLGSVLDLGPDVCVPTPRVATTQRNEGAPLVHEN